MGRTTSDHVTVDDWGCASCTYRWPGTPAMQLATVATITTARFTALPQRVKDARWGPRPRATPFCGRRPTGRLLTAGRKRPATRHLDEARNYRRGMKTVESARTTLRKWPFYVAIRVFRSEVACPAWFAQLSMVSRSY